MLIPLIQLILTQNPIKFKGSVDAILKKGDEILIIDWKTSKKTEGASGYRQQLETYKRLYAADKNIPLEKIKVAICFIGLRKIINDGNIDYEYDSTQPRKNVFETVTKHLQKFLEWKEHPETFLNELIAVKDDDDLLRCIKEQVVKEKGNN